MCYLYLYLPDPFELKSLSCNPLYQYEESNAEQKRTHNITETCNHTKITKEYFREADELTFRSNKKTAVLESSTLADCSLTTSTLNTEKLEYKTINWKLSICPDLKIMWNVDNKMYLQKKKVTSPHLPIFVSRRLAEVGVHCPAMKRRLPWAHPDRRWGAWLQLFSAAKRH